MKLIRSFDRSEIRRLRVYGSLQEGCTFVELAWDNGYSDPVWRLGIEFELPRVVHWLIDRWWAWRLRRRRAA